MVVFVVFFLFGIQTCALVVICFSVTCHWLFTDCPLMFHCCSCVSIDLIMLCSFYVICRYDNVVKKIADCDSVFCVILQVL